MPGDTKEKIRNTIANEVKFFIGLIVFVITGVAPYYNIKQDIALIQKDIEIINGNHLRHIQDLTQANKDINAQQLEMQKQIYLLMKE